MAKLKLNVDRLGLFDPGITGINQFGRYPSYGSPHDAEVTGDGFTTDFVPNVYRVDGRGVKIKVGKIIDKTYETSRKVYFTLSLEEDVAPGDDKIVGIKCGGFDEVFSNPAKIDEKYKTT